MAVVVTDFQWHMERSQDEIMNSSDSVRDSQGKLALFDCKQAATRVRRVLRHMSHDTVLWRNTLRSLYTLLLLIFYYNYYNNKQRDMLQWDSRLIFWDD